LIGWGTEQLPIVEIRLLGSPRFSVAGIGQALPEKAYVLLAILAAAEARRATRIHLRTILWADSEREKANANLRQLIARIHRAEQACGVVLLATEGESLALMPDCRVDYADFLRAVEDDAEPAARCAALTNLWRGALLEGVTCDEPAIDEWLESRREQMRQRFMEAGRRVLEAELPAEHAEAQWQLAEKIVAIDPTEEVAYRSMMRLCIARDDRASALRIFKRCERILEEELEVAPDAKTLALAATLRDPEARKLSAAPAGAKGPAAARTADRQVPVVMVLPPMGASLDPTFATLAAGLAEDITVGLTRFRRFSVVASPTPGMMNLKDRCHEIGLSVFDIDYTVALSLMPATHGYRLAVRLTDAGNSEVLWGANPEFTTATVGGTFDRLIRLTVRTLVDVIDTRQARAAMTAERASAYALCAQGRLLLNKADLQAIRRAKKLFKQALAQFPDYPPAIVGIARATSEEWLVRGMVEPDLLKESVVLARRAMQLDPLDGRAMRERGRVNLYMRRYDESLEAFDAALALNPDDADILSDYGDSLAHSGDPQRGLPLSRKAMELNPAQPDDYVWTLGSIHFQLGEYQAALDVLRPMDGSAATARLLTACAARAGDQDSARRYGQMVRETYPKFAVASVRDIVPNRNPADTEHLIDGLRLAGLA
jgi:DNA-binding SARP family transcriptional activator/tetratricopeptide (TPR) repeat protein